MKTIRRVLLVSLAVLAVLVILRLLLPGYLSVHKPVDSRNILVESWISHHEIEQVATLYGSQPGARFFVVGRVFPEARPVSWPQPWSEAGTSQDGGTWLYANATLEFRIPDGFRAPHQDTTVVISVEVKGQAAGGLFAYFNLVVNGECLGGKFSTGSYSFHDFQWDTRRGDIRTLSLRFINDLKRADSDRNLNIRAVHLGDLALPAVGESIRVTRTLDRMATGYDNQAAEVAGYLQAIGIGPEKITTIPFDPPERNLTLGAAREFARYLSNREIDAFNVVSSDVHCRRTWVTYRHLAGKEVDVGILNYSEKGEENAWNRDDRPYELHLLDEFIALLGNAFQLLFE